MALFVVMPQLPAAAMAIYPFIIVKHSTYKNNLTLINHEKIHHRQQLELFILPFYLIYVINYLINLVKYASHHKAYCQIVFEKEAYHQEQNLSYLQQRRPFSWLAFV